MLLEMLSSLLAEYNLQIGIVFILVFTVSFIVLRIPKNLPPGPIGLPIIGYLPFIGTHLPRGVVKIGKDYNSDVISVWLGPQLFVFLNSYAAVKEAFHGDLLTERPDSFFYRRFLSKESGLLCSYGQLWKDHRRFSLSALRDFGMGKMLAEEHILDEVKYLSSEIEKLDKQVVNLKTLFNTASSNIICITAFGKHFQYDDEEFISYADKMQEYLRLIGYNALGNIFPFLRHLPGDLTNLKRINVIFADVCGFIDKQMAEHKERFDAKNIQDFTDACIAEQEKHKGTENTFTDEHLRWDIFELFFAGTETSSTTLQWAILYMMTSPDVQKKVQKELDDVLGMDRTPTFADRRHLPYTDATLLEIMRLGVVGPLALPHCNNQHDVQVCGYTIPKGTYVHPNIWYIQRDPEIWASPEDFDPMNFLNEKGEVVCKQEFIPFSVGRRQCLGESLARMELFVMFASLMQTFKFTIPPGEPEPSLEPAIGMVYTPQPYKTLVDRRF